MRTAFPILVNGFCINGPPTPLPVPLPSRNLPRTWASLCHLHCYLRGKRMLPFSLKVLTLRLDPFSPHSQEVGDQPHPIQPTTPGELGRFPDRAVAPPLPASLPLSHHCRPQRIFNFLSLFQDGLRDLLLPALFAHLIYPFRSPPWQRKFMFQREESRAPPRSFFRR